MRDKNISISSPAIIFNALTVGEIVINLLMRRAFLQCEGESDRDGSSPSSSAGSSSFVSVDCQGLESIPLRDRV